MRLRPYIYLGIAAILATAGYFIFFQPTDNGELSSNSLSVAASGSLSPQVQFLEEQSEEGSTLTISWSADTYAFIPTHVQVFVAKGQRLSDQEMQTIMGARIDALESCQYRMGIIENQVVDEECEHTSGVLHTGICYGEEECDSSKQNTVRIQNPLPGSTYGVRYASGSRYSLLSNVYATEQEEGEGVSTNASRIENASIRRLDTSLELEWWTKEPENSFELLWAPGIFRTGQELSFQNAAETCFVEIYGDSTCDLRGKPYSAFQEYFDQTVYLIEVDEREKEGTYGVRVPGGRVSIIGKSYGRIGSEQRAKVENSLTPSKPTLDSIHNKKLEGRQVWIAQPIQLEGISFTARMPPRAFFLAFSPALCRKNTKKGGDSMGGITKVVGGLLVAYMATSILFGAPPPKKPGDILWVKDRNGLRTEVKATDDGAIFELSLYYTGPKGTKVSLPDITHGAKSCLCSRRRESVLRGKPCKNIAFIASGRAQKETFFAYTSQAKGYVSITY